MEKMMANREAVNGFSDDILINILSRLDALSFASSACVNKTWRRVSNQILRGPKIASAVSLNPSTTGAVGEVLDRVLGKPIRPDFGIACISQAHDLRLTHDLLTAILGARTPLVTYISHGVMGKDTLTNELKEVQQEYVDSSCPHPCESNANQGMVLVVGYLPGLKIDAIPLFHPKDPENTMPDYDKFVREIKAYTAAASSYEFPKAIIMFGDRNSNTKYVVAKLDHSMPKDTVIIGDAGGCFLFNGINHIISADLYTFDAVTLVFAQDQNKSPDVGETEFHVIMAGGLMQFEPRFEVTSVAIKPLQKCSWISAKVEGLDVLLNIDTVLDTIDQMVNNDEPPNLYIAVTQNRHYYGERKRLGTSTAFYEVRGGGGPSIFIDGIGVRPGDSFVFYHSDVETAHTSNAIAFEKLEIVKQNTRNNDGVFGGLIFSCHHRGESYFKQPNVDILPFSLNFPKVPVAGMFCKGEIGRGSSCFIREEEYQQQCPAHCCIHAGSVIYLVMSYIPPTSV